MKKIFLMMPLLAMIACQDSETESEEITNIDFIKTGFLQMNRDVAVGEKLDTWQACEKTEWSELASVQGKVMVEYRCHTKNIPSYMTKLRQVITERRRKTHGTQFAEELKGVIVEINKVTKVASLTKKIQWVIHKDGSFSAEYADQVFIWENGKQSKQEYEPISLIKAAYNNTNHEDERLLENNFGSSLQAENMYRILSYQYPN